MNLNSIFLFTSLGLLSTAGNCSSNHWRSYSEVVKAGYIFTPGIDAWVNVANNGLLYTVQKSEGTGGWAILLDRFVETDVSPTRHEIKELSADKSDLLPTKIIERTTPAGESVVAVTRRFEANDEDDPTVFTQIFVVGKQEARLLFCGKIHDEPVLKVSVDGSIVFKDQKLDCAAKSPARACSTTIYKLQDTIVCK